MATYIEVSDTYTRFLQNPAPAGSGICPVCRGFPNAGYTYDRGCGQQPNQLDAVVPISYEPVGEQLHVALRNYKEIGDQASIPLRRVIAAILWRFLETHESCVAAAAGVEAFDLVTTVPSKTRANDEQRDRFRDIIGRACRPTADRYERVLRAAGDVSTGRGYDPKRFTCTRPLDGVDVLLIDDTWTTGGDAQSAGAALKAAGAPKVGFVAVGRWVRTGYEDLGARLAALPQEFDWGTCAVHR